jgi:hypothetical protein
MSHSRVASLLALGLLAVSGIHATLAVRSAVSAGPYRGLPPSLAVSSDTVDFGGALVHSVASEVLVIANVGGSPLVLGELAVDAGQFSVGGHSGGVPPGTEISPGDSLDVPTFFRPRVLGPAAARLTIPSNDPLRPVVAVELRGEGVEDPPILSVLTDSVHASVEFGDTTTTVRPLVIANRGDLPLTFSISVLPSVPPGRGTPTDDLEGIRILWDRTHNQPGSINSSLIVGDLTDRGAVVEEVVDSGGGDPITPSLLSGYQIYLSLDTGSPWSGSEIAALDDWTRAGGGILLMADNPSGIASYNDLLSGLGAHVRYTALGASGQTVTTNIPGRPSGHPTAEGVSRIWLGLGIKALDSVEAPAETLVLDLGGHPVAVAEPVGSGRCLVLSDEMLEDGALLEAESVSADNRRFGNQIVGWLVASYWVRTDPFDGIILPDEFTIVSLLFDTDELAGGDYDLNLRISSNDPATPFADVPVHLFVHGVPMIEVEPSSYAFGSVPVHTTADTTLVIRNQGSEPLLVEALNTTGTPFEVSFGNLTVPGGGADTIDGTFRPDRIGPLTGSIILVSNSGGGSEPDSLEIPWTGSGRVNCRLPCEAPSLRPATLDATHGYEFWLPVVLTQNPEELVTFGFELEYDPDILTFPDSSNVRVGSLTEGYFPLADENEPGRLTCGGILGNGDPIPAGATGSLVELRFRVDCPACVPGDSTDVAVGDLSAGLASGLVNPCCGLVRIAACPTGDGDVNADSVLSATDALCALKIFVNGGQLPDDPDCQANGECEVDRADANCSGDVDPDDALAIWEHVVCDLEPEPTPCIGNTAPDSSCLGGGGDPVPARRTGAIRWSGTGANGGGEILYSLEATGPIPFFGVELSLDPDALRFVRVELGDVTAPWDAFVSGTPAPGVVRLGGFRSDRGGDAGELARLVFAPLETADESPLGVRIERAFGVGIEGAREAWDRLGTASSGVAGLEGVTPNPAGSSVTITFGVSRASARIALRVHDVAGRLVRELITGTRPAGRHSVVWDGRDNAGGAVASGTYFVRLTVDERTWVRKMIRVR